MKKSIVILLALLLLAFPLASCGNTQIENDNISVVTTIFPPYDFARQIGGDLVNVKMLLSPGSESHSYEPTTADMKAIQNCDIFVYTGGENDAWVEDMLSSLNTDDIKIIAMTALVDTVEEEILEGMQADEHEHEEDEDGEEHEEHEYDEHVWTSPKNAIKIASAIGDALCEKDAKNSAAYKSGLSEYIKVLEKLDKDFADMFAGASAKTIVVGDRFPFRYFADEYGLECFAAFPGCSAESDASASTIAFLINKVKDSGIKNIFKIELSNEKVAETISEATGASILELHSCHNLSANDFSAGLTYIDLMYRNLENLREALK